MSTSSKITGHGRAPLVGAAAGLALSLSGLRAADAQPIERFLAAAQRSTDVREGELVARQRADESTQALGRLLPSLSARGAYTFNQFEVGVTLPTSGAANQITITPRNQVDLTVSVDVPLVDVAAWARLDAARQSEAASQVRVRATLDDVSRSVARSYFQWVGASALVTASERALDVATRSIERLRARNAAGAALVLDIQRAEAEAARARLTLADARLTVATAARALATATGITPTVAPTLGDNLRDEAPLAQWEQDALGTPSVRAAITEARAAGAQARASWWSLAPTVNATAGERITNAAGFGQPATFTAGVAVNWRIDVTAVASARAAESVRSVAELRVARAISAARDQVHSAWWQVRTGIERARAARAQLAASEAAASAARERLARGAGTDFDVLAAERDAFSAEVSRVQADADLSFARISLRLSAGRPLVEGGAR